MPSVSPIDVKKPSRVHLLDVGRDQYGDCVLCEVRGHSILIDGGHRADLHGSAGHPSIPTQLADLLGIDAGATCHVSLLIISHAHDDHVGCLPEMVAQGLLTADWALMVDPDFAWGSANNAGGDTAVNQSIDRLTSLLREEPRDDLSDRLAFNAAVADAAGLQKRYREMIARLKKNGTTVVLHGRSALGPLHDHFKDIGLRVLGPPKKQLEACRDIIVGFGRDMRRDLATKVQSDAAIFEIYRELQLIAARQDASDAFKGPGPAINLQSSIVVFGDGKHRFLFTGDAQLEKPEVNSDDVDAGVSETLAAIAEHQPYDFVKLGHHGSHNAFGETFLEQIGEQSVNFGICTGSESLHHPSAAALKLLKENKERLTWARTDRNGRSTFTFGAGDPIVEVTHRSLNDLTMPGDLLEPKNRSLPPLPAQAAPEFATAPSPPPSPPIVQVAPGPLPGPIEIKIPYSPQFGVSLSLKLDIAPSPPLSSVSAGPIIDQTEPSAVGFDKFQLASGRRLPKLLFATSEVGLGSNIGAAVTRKILTALRDAGHVVISEIPKGVLESQATSEVVRTKLRVHGDVAGVVLLGGLDVIPSQRRDALSPELRRKVRSSDDDDNFIVWSDAIYGDVDGDGLAELPVSRIPDGRSASLVLRALSAPKAATLSRRNGVRNVMRPFADAIYANLRGTSDILRSHPTSVANSQHRIDGDHVYLMLHGDYIDATRFWGETEDSDTLEVVNLSTVAVPPGSVVFTGCCWGALTVREPACSIRPGIAVTARTPDQSLALRFLEQGALALLGCTGTHYSPTEEPYNYFGGPMHQEFWAALFKQDGAPAPALFEAKKRYLAGIPHVSSGETVEAIERKIYEQYTCLGLGW